MGFSIRSGNYSVPGGTPGWRPRAIQGGSPTRLPSSSTPSWQPQVIEGGRPGAPQRGLQPVSPRTGNPITGNPATKPIRPQLPTPTPGAAANVLFAIPVLLDLTKQVRNVVFGNPDAPPTSFDQLGLVDIARAWGDALQGRDPLVLQPAQIGVGDLLGLPFDPFPNTEGVVSYPPNTFGVWTWMVSQNGGNAQPDPSTWVWETRTQIGYYSPAFFLEVAPSGGSDTLFLNYRSLDGPVRQGFNAVEFLNDWYVVGFEPTDGTPPIEGEPGQVSNPLPSSFPIPGASPIQPNPTNPAAQPINQATAQPIARATPGSQTELIPGQVATPINPGAGPLRGATDRIPGQSPIILPSPQTIPGIKPEPGKIPNESIVPTNGTSKGFQPQAQRPLVTRTTYFKDPLAQELSQIKQKQEECCFETNSGIGDLADLLFAIQQLLDALQPQTEQITIPRIVCTDGVANDDPLQLTVPAGFGDAIANQFNQLAAIRAQLCENLEVIEVPIVSCMNNQPQTSNIEIAVAVGTGDQVLAQFEQLAALRAWQCASGFVPEPGEEPPDQPNPLTRILALLGDTDFPVTVPTTLISKEGVADTTTQLQNLPQFLAWLTRQFDAIMGQWEIPLEIQDTDLTQAGDQTAKIKLPNLAEAVAEQVGLLMNLTASVNALSNIGMRTLTEAGSAHKEAAIAHMYGRENAQFLAYEGKEVNVKIPMTFNPGAESLEDTLKNTEVSIRGWENVDKQDLKFYLHEFLSTAAIIRAVYWHRLDPKGNLKDQIKKFIRDADLLDKTQNQADSDFDQFLNDVEQGFTTQPGISDPTNPYGRDITRRPRIRKLGGNPDNGSNNQ